MEKSFPLTIQYLRMYAHTHTHTHTITKEGGVVEEFKRGTQDRRAERQEEI